MLPECFGNAPKRLELQYPDPRFRWGLHDSSGAKANCPLSPLLCFWKILYLQIEELNQNDDIDGFIIQLPLPPQINTQKVLMAVDPSKDVDGFHPENIGLLAQGVPKRIPCTPLGICYLLEYINYDIQGKSAVIVGSSIIVGKPMAHLLLTKNATLG